MLTKTPPPHLFPHQLPMKPSHKWNMSKYFTPHGPFSAPHPTLHQPQGCTVKPSEQLPLGTEEKSLAHGMTAFLLQTVGVQSQT